MENTQIVQAEVHAAPRPEDETSPVEEEIRDKDVSHEEDQPVVEFEDQGQIPGHDGRRRGCRGTDAYTEGTSRIPGADKSTPMTGRDGKENDEAVTHSQGENEG